MRQRLLTPAFSSSPSVSFNVRQFAAPSGLAGAFGLLGVLMYAVTNRFSADALEQIRMTAPKQTAMAIDLASNPRTNLDLFSVTVVFIIVSSVFILLVCSSVTEVVRKTGREVTREVAFARLNH
jgi:hypothetical protein